ncbi:MAG: hypothetical protein COB83_08040 [Gammaproteobacteria bacterium]|nr:MAG: hypothetical protein COB83_08040 [Gammaproteobacteria bacterium]
MGGRSRFLKNRAARINPKKAIKLEREPRYKITPVIGLTGRKKNAQLKKNKKALRRAKNRGYKVTQASVFNPRSRYTRSAR